MMNHDCSSCTSGPMTTPRSWRPGCARRSTRSTWPGARGEQAVHTTVLLAAVLACLGLQARAGETETPLALERTIPLANVSGRIDHMAVDLRRGRLFVAELGNNTVDVVELAAGHVIHRIEGLKEPQGIAYSPRSDIVAVANASDG